VCHAGGNVCPPEDVGGQYGYADFLKAVADPRHEEHTNMLVWAGGSFDPTALHLQATTQIPKTINPRPYGIRVIPAIYARCPLRTKYRPKH